MSVSDHACDEESAEPAPPRPRPQFETLLWRGLRLRCPRCGEGHLFRGLIRMPKRCPVCGLLFDRAPGYYLGSTYINYGATALTTTAVFIIGRIYLHVPTRLLIWPLAIFCLLFPLLMFRHARGLWLALDCQFDSSVLEDDEIREQQPGDAGR